MLKIVKTKSSKSSGLKIIKKANETIEEITPVIEAKKEVITTKTVKEEATNKKSFFERVLNMIGLSYLSQQASTSEDLTKTKKALEIEKIKFSKKEAERVTMQKHLSANQAEVKRLKNILSGDEQEIAKVDKEAFDKEKLQAWSKRIRSVGKCDICSDTNRLVAHHLWDKNTVSNIAYHDDNGVCLCLTHHNQFHKEYNDGSYCTPRQYEAFKERVKKEIMHMKSNQENAA